MELTRAFLLTGTGYVLGCDYVPRHIMFDLKKVSFQIILIMSSIRC